jgi:deoxyribonuclease-4
MLEIGAHLSISGGVDQAILRAEELSLPTLQIFTKNASQWAAKPLDPATIEKFASEWKRTGLGQIVAHDSYLINVASPDDANWEKSRLALQNELDRCDQLSVPYLVSHPGGHMGSGVDAGVARVIKAINQIVDERPDGKCVLLLETTAGQGTTLGRSFEELAAIIAGVEDKTRVGVCFDTCHVFSAGYDIRDKETYEATMAAFDSIIGLSYLKAFHLNDSIKGLGSNTDRHAHIGEGSIGRTAFELLLNDDRFNGISGLLETKHGDNMVELKGDLETLRGMTAA